MPSNFETHALLFLFFGLVGIAGLILMVHAQAEAMIRSQYCRYCHALHTIGRHSARMGEHIRKVLHRLRTEESQRLLDAQLRASGH
jgi:hypothetical protein